MSDRPHSDEICPPGERACWHCRLVDQRDQFRQDALKVFRDLVAEHDAHMATKADLTRAINEIRDQHGKELCHLLGERDRLKERLQQSLDGTAELMEECRRLRFEPDRLRVQIGELEAGCEACEERLHEARQAARRYFKWINDDEFPDTEHTEMELAKYPWLEEGR